MVSETGDDLKVVTKDTPTSDGVAVRTLSEINDDLKKVNAKEMDGRFSKCLHGC
jgi:hypothetical protein